MPRFEFSPCTPTDVPSMVNLYLRAFTPSFTTYIFHPSSRSHAPPAVHSWLAARFIKQMTQSGPEMKFFKIEDVETGRLAALGRFGFPFELSAEEKAEREQAEKMQEEQGKFPEGANLGAAVWLFAAMDEMREKYLKWDQDYICYLLITDPDFQRQGLGRELLGHVTALADTENRRVYLEATVPGQPLYEKMGFIDVDLITLDMKQWGGDEKDEFSIMIREPQPSTVV